ncbi:thermonuclease family protein [Oceanibaculum nanhaiense]|uniref:thermonuclease family protein n=1 Tax=Oceanibaculum nanhaiense TaxID=1909734 RepID=UPI003D2C496C
MMLRASLIIMMITITPAMADSPARIPGPVPANYLSAYDGDTVTVRAWIWPGQSVETAVRVRGIDTPEIRGECESEKAAVAARDHARQLLQEAGEVALAQIAPDKYGGRVVATLLVDGEDFAELMLAAGHGRPYDGGRREGWCAGIVQ